MLKLFCMSDFISKLREVAAKRTEGTWLAVRREVMRLGASAMGGERLVTCDGGYASHDGENQENDAAFIAQAANTYDLLLDIAEVLETANNYFKQAYACENQKYCCRMEDGRPSEPECCIRDDFAKALAALESSNTDT